jgi:UDP-N-acetylmuramoyl-tripeptide--D-alanyl-D-alanine ligase
MATVIAVVLSAGLVAGSSGGRLVRGSADRVFDAVSTDSRNVPAGALFIALVGERFDGHAFVGAAIARGAAGLLVAGRSEAEVLRVVDEAGPHAPAVIVVEDTLAALQTLGREIRRRAGTRVVAITGSAGKTTTKEVTAALLSTRYRVFRNRGNLNNHIGLPLSLLELRSGPDIAVVELGMNHVGEIRLLVGLAEPEIRVWTNVGDAHIGQFGSREGIAAAKAELLEGATPSTVVVANADDPLVMKHVERAAGRHVTFGEAIDADVRAVQIAEHGLDGSDVTVAAAGRTVRLRVPLPGRAQVGNVLAAVAVAIECGVAPADIVDGVAALKPVARRGAVTELGDGTRIFDDSYNASPAAVSAMLAALAATPTHGRRVAVLGEMLELGDAALALHERCGRAAADAGVDELIVVGGDTADGLVAGAMAGGLPASRVHRFATSVEAAAAVSALVKAGDLVLVKGSRGTRTDVIVDRLTEVA